jgi:MoxR-like ATPase
VILTSNRTRELHDALRRRCVYHWIGYPSVDREVAIVRARAPRRPRAPGPPGRGVRGRAARARAGQGPRCGGDA